MIGWKGQIQKMYKYQPLKQNNLKKGFSLIELLVAITLSLLILGALYSVYYISQKLYVKSADKAELNQNGRISLERIARDLRQTPKITTIFPTTGDLSSPSIMFQDGNVIDQIQYIEYSLVNNELHRKLTHYCPPAPETCNSQTGWVAYNYPNAVLIPDKDDIKADKIFSLVFYRDPFEPIVTVGVTARDDQDNIARFRTEVYCRNNPL